MQKIVTPFCQTVMERRFLGKPCKWSPWLFQIKSSKHQSLFSTTYKLTYQYDVLQRNTRKLRSFCTMKAPPYLPKKTQSWSAIAYVISLTKKYEQ